MKLLPDHLVTHLKEVRCDPRLNDHDASLKGVPFVDAFTGDVIAEIPMQGVNRVSRMKLRRFLTEGQNLNIEVHFPHNVKIRIHLIRLDSLGRPSRT